MTMLLTMLRSALFNVFFFASTFLLCLWGVGLRLLAPERTPALVRFWSRLEIGAARAVCGIRFAVSGQEHLAPGACLIASQHQSTFDTLVWPLLVPDCSYVLKRELTRIPLFGPLIGKAGMIVVDRAGGAGALRALMREGRQAAAAGRQVVIFPEGSRAPPGQPLPVQPGIAALAASMGLPVFPAVTDSGLFWGRRAFRKRPGCIRIAILPPLPADLPRAALQQRLQALFGAGVPVDNSVGVAPARLSTGRSSVPQPIDQV